MKAKVNVQDAPVSESMGVDRVGDISGHARDHRDLDAGGQLPDLSHSSDVSFGMTIAVINSPGSGSPSGTHGIAVIRRVRNGGGLEVGSLLSQHLPGGSLHIREYSPARTGVDALGTVPAEISPSRSGAALGQVLFTVSPSCPSYYTEAANPTTGGSAIFSSIFNASASKNVAAENSPVPVVAASNGTLIATSMEAAISSVTPGTNILQNGTPSTPVIGIPIRRIDDPTLFVVVHYIPQ